MLFSTRYTAFNSCRSTAFASSKRCACCCQKSWPAASLGNTAACTGVADVAYGGACRLGVVRDRSVKHEDGNDGCVGSGDATSGCRAERVALRLRRAEDEGEEELAVAAAAAWTVAGLRGVRKSRRGEGEGEGEGEPSLSCRNGYFTRESV